MKIWLGRCGKWRSGTQHVSGLDCRGLGLVSGGMIQNKQQKASKTWDELKEVRKLNAVEGGGVEWSEYASVKSKTSFCNSRAHYWHDSCKV